MRDIGDASLNANGFKSKYKRTCNCDELRDATLEIQQVVVQDGGGGGTAVELSMRAPQSSSTLVTAIAGVARLWATSLLLDSDDGTGCLVDAERRIVVDC